MVHLQNVFERSKSMAVVFDNLKIIFIFLEFNIITHIELQHLLLRLGLPELFYA